MSDFRIIYGLNEDTENFVSQRVQNVSVRVRGVNDKTREKEIFAERRQDITKFVEFCDNQHRLAGRGHSHFRMQRGDFEYQYVNNNGQPVVHVAPPEQEGSPDNVILQDDPRTLREERADFYGSVLIQVNPLTEAVTIEVEGATHTIPPFVTGYLYTEPEPTEDEPLDDGQIPQHVLDEAGWTLDSEWGTLIKLPGKPRLVAFAIGYMQYEDADGTGNFPEARWATPLDMVSYPYPVPMFAYDMRVSAEPTYAEFDRSVAVPQYNTINDTEPLDFAQLLRRLYDDPNTFGNDSFVLPTHHIKRYDADIDFWVYFYVQATPTLRQRQIPSLAAVFKDNPITLTSFTFVDLVASDILRNMYRYDWGDPHGVNETIPDSPQARDFHPDNRLGAGYDLYKWHVISGESPDRENRVRISVDAEGYPLDPRLVAPLRIAGSTAAVERGYALEDETFTIIPPPASEDDAVYAELRLLEGGTAHSGSVAGTWPLYAYMSTSYVVADSADRPPSTIETTDPTTTLIPEDKTPFIKGFTSLYTQGIAVDLTVSSLPSAGDRYTADGTSINIANRGVSWAGSDTLRADDIREE